MSRLLHREHIIRCSTPAISAGLIRIGFDPHRLQLKCLTTVAMP